MNIKLLFIIVLSVSVSICYAQSLKEAAKGQQKKPATKEQSKKESDIKEKSKALENQFSLNDLLLLQKNNLAYAEDFLSRRNWKLDKTSIDNDSYLYGLLPVSYNTVTWAYNKNSWNNKAEGWFQFYQYDELKTNFISYQMSSSDAFVQIKTDLQNSKGYKLIQTKVIDEGIETIYKSDKLEISMMKYNASVDHSHYIISIYNYKERDQLLKEERERKQRAYEEEMRAREEQLRIEREEEIKEEMYQDFVQQAQTFKKQKKYNEAKKSYQRALEVDPDNSQKKRYIAREIEEIDKISQFLNERAYKIYVYSDLLHSDYTSVNTKITENLKDLLSKEKKVNSIDITISCTIDTAGIITRSYTSTVKEPELDKKIQQIVNNITLTQPSLHGYTVSSKADFSYSIRVEEDIVKVKKSSKGLKYKSGEYYAYKQAIDKIVSSAPMGNFTVQFNKTTINSKSYMEQKLLKYSGTGRGTNAFLSLLIPGLGDHRVTYGKKTGLGITLPTYALIGTGIGLKFYSINEYKKYHNATEQQDMDKYYNQANYSNQAFYACLVAGGIIWISDIIWVWAKGAKNRKVQKAYKRQYLGFYYHPQLNVSGLTYTVNF
jgi:tetratricopeptide (TPR) repeat protein